MRCDLHNHSTFSDGHYTPTELVKRAAKEQVDCLAITDHDTTAGLEEALAAGEAQGVEVVPGIEISTWGFGGELHILGYFFDPTNEDLQAQLKVIQEDDDRRHRQMLQRLGELGIEVSLEQVQEKAGERTMSRTHIAQVLVEQGVTASVNEAFDRFLGDQGAAFVPFVTSPQKAIRLVRGAGGAAVLAHPCYLHNRGAITELARAGLAGIEAYYPNHDQQQERDFIKLAAELGLVATGGSDFHYADLSNHGHFAEVTVDYQVVEDLRKRAAQAGD